MPYDPDSLNLFGKVTMWIVCLSVFPICLIVELGVSEPMTTGKSDYKKQGQDPWADQQKHRSDDHLTRNALKVETEKEIKEADDDE